jgi:hypothetical protein
MQMDIFGVRPYAENKGVRAPPGTERGSVEGPNA